MLKKLISNWEDLYTSKPLDKFLQGVKDYFDDEEINEEAVQQLHRYFQLNDQKKKNLISNTDYIQQQSEISTVAYGTLKKITETYLPILPVRAIAGTDAGPQYAIEYQQIEEWKYISAGNIKNKIGIRVEGDSMNPDYLDGDILLCKKVTIDTITDWQPFVVVGTNNSIYLKRIKKIGSKLKMISINPNFPEFEYPLRDVAEIWLVESKIK